jgi:hypothetical protein
VLTPALSDVFFYRRTVPDEMVATVEVALLGPGSTAHRSI